MIGTTVAHYEVLEKLGEGGMGEVYRAHDTKLNRDVALKILPQIFAQDSQRMARFEREAQVLASLNHTHIAQIHGLEETDGTKALVLELVEGETLQEQIARGPIPVDEALKIALQICEGLEAAHEKGVIHRDLKPANIKITPEGEVKILDFGLAKAMEAEVPASELSHSPTISHMATQAGVILGTASYMSPEQVKGANINHRSDIWAFGVLLYEMLSGSRLFTADSLSEILADVLRSSIDWDELPSGIPYSIRQLLRRCLTRDPTNRLQAIGEARIQLKNVVSGAKDDSPIPWPNRRTNSHLWFGFGGLLAGIIVAALLGVLILPEAEPRLKFHAEINMPEGERLIPFFRHGIALSSDGQHLAFVAGIPRSTLGGPGQSQIYLRSLDQTQLRPLTGTRNALNPIFSPDGAWIAFVQDGYLKKISLAGGEPKIICKIDKYNRHEGGTLPAQSFGMDWGSDGSIIYSTGGPLYQVPDSGVEAVQVSQFDKASNEVAHYLPKFLPDNQWVLYTALFHRRSASPRWERSRIMAISLKTGEKKLLLENGTDARYIPSGHLIFIRDGRVLASLFDPENIELQGQPVPVIEGIRHEVGRSRTLAQTGASQLAISKNGVLVYAEGGVVPELLDTVFRVDRNGIEESVDAIQPGAYGIGGVSPDGSQLLVRKWYPPRGVWLLDVERGTLRPQTSDSNTLWAIWGPGPNQFTYDSDHEGTTSIYVKELNSLEGQETKLEIEPKGFPRVSSWSSDGKKLAFVMIEPETAADVWVLFDDGRSEPILRSRFNEHYPEFSPDDKWLAYVSDESGQEEVYVTPFPGPIQSEQISVGGGTAPAWSSDGKEIVYRQGPNKEVFVASEISLESSKVRVLSTTKLFQGPYRTARPIRTYYIDKTGRFWLTKGPDERALARWIEEVYPNRIQLVTGFFEELNRLVPTE